MKARYRYFSLFLFTFSILFSLKSKQFSTRDVFLNKKLYASIDESIKISYDPKDNFHIVESGRLYRCAQLVASRLEQYLKKYKIKSIISFRKKLLPHERRAALKNGAAWHRFPMRSSTFPSKKVVLDLIEKFESLPKPILIHCLHGQNRTGLAAALWKLYVQKVGREKALAQLVYGYDQRKYPRIKFLLNNIKEDKDLLVKNYSIKQFEKNYQNSIKR